MSEIKLYIELHWGKRRPKFELFLNKQIVHPSDTIINQHSAYQENAIVTYYGSLSKNNQLEIVMTDKQDQDLVQVDNKYIDHWLKVRELEVNGIKFETCLYNACAVRHSMPDAWVNQMEQQGYTIQKEYPNGTDIRLNGTWSIQFATPIWQWCSERFDK